MNSSEIKVLINDLIEKSKQKNCQNIGGVLSALRSKHKEVYEFLKQEMDRLQCKSVSEVIYLIVHDMESVPLCIDCNHNHKSFKDFNDGYKDRCVDCARTYSRNITANVQRKYGVNNTMNIPGTKERWKENFKNKHGVENPQQLPEVREKTNQTNLDRYGVSCSLLSEQAQKKTKETNLVRFGCEHHMQSEEYKQNFHNRIAETQEYKDNVSRIIDVLNQHDLELAEPYVNAGTNLILRCKKCNTVFEGCNWNALSSDHNHIETQCKTCHPPKGICFSIEETRIIDYVKERIPNIEVIHRKGSRMILDNHKELDVYFPEYKLAVEYCGLFRHNSSDIQYDGKTKDPNYHFNKYYECLQKGIHLITVFDKRKSKNWIEEIYQKLTKTEIINIDNLEFIKENGNIYYELDCCQYSYDNFPLKDKFEFVKQLGPKCWFYNDILHPDFIEYNKFKECYCVDGEDPFEFARDTEYCKWYHDCGWQLLRLK